MHKFLLYINPFTYKNAIILYVISISIFYSGCKSSNIPDLDKNLPRISAYLKAYKGDQDHAFKNYLEECLSNSEEMIIPASVHLKLQKGNYIISKPFTIKGEGTISGNHSNHLFIIEDGAKIKLVGISFVNFLEVVHVGSTDKKFELVADSIKVDRCRSFIHSKLNNFQRKEVGPITIQNSNFSNNTGPVIHLRNLYLTNVLIQNNRFFNTESSIIHQKACVEIGGGSNFSRAKNISIIDNTISDFTFKGKSYGIIIHGASAVLIKENVLKNLITVDFSGQTYGIYIKASDAEISHNQLLNAGDAEASIINKGLASKHARTTPGTAPGNDVIIHNNTIRFTNSYHKKVKKILTGITVTGDNQIVKNNTIENVSHGIELRSGSLIKSKNYIGNFEIVSNTIRSFQNHTPNANVVRGIILMQASNHALLENNTIVFNEDIELLPDQVYGISILCNTDTRDIVITKNKILNQLPANHQNQTIAINFRTIGRVEDVHILPNEFKKFKTDILLNDNNLKSVFKNIVIEPRAKNSDEKYKLRKLLTKPDAHKIINKSNF